MILEWLFTMKPHMFGLIPGIANLTGWALLLILIVMIPCSMPFIRRNGSFEVGFFEKVSVWWLQTNFINVL